MGNMHGVQVEVTEEYTGRMQAKGQGSNTMEFEATAAGISTGSGGTKKNERGSVGFQLDNSEAMINGMLDYANLKEVATTGENNIRLTFIKGLQSHTLLVNAKSSVNRKELLESIRKYDNAVWIHEYDATVIGAFKHLKHAFTDEKSTCVMKIHAIPEFCIDVLLKSTMFAVDVKDGDKEGRWMLCFAGAMFWLALFSYAMLEMANMIHYNIKSVPTAFLGITVCAIGTSFPNAVASVIMAGQNKPAAAIANALGSNVQNVFLAMAMPWVIFQCFPGKQCPTEKMPSPPPDLMAVQYAPIGAAAAGLSEGILWMVFTLVLLLVFVLLPQTCTLSKGYGVVLIAVYFVYLGRCSYTTFVH